MAQATFDTLEYTKTLRDAGFTEQQAEALARAQNDAFWQMADARDLASKGDIARLDAKIDRLDAKIDRLAVQTEAKMAEMEARLVKSFHNALYGFAGLIIAAIACAVAILK